MFKLKKLLQLCLGWFLEKDLSEIDCGARMEAKNDVPGAKSLLYRENLKRVWRHGFCNGLNKGQE